MLLGWAVVRCERMNVLSRLYAAHIRRSGERVNGLLATFKKRRFSALSGTVVEIGPGAGANCEFLPTKVKRYIGVEPNSFLRETLLSRAARMPMIVQCVEGKAEQLPLPSNFADAVISTFVLCSVSDEKAALF